MSKQSATPGAPSGSTATRRGGPSKTPLAVGAIVLTVLVVVVGAVVLGQTREVASPGPGVDVTPAGGIPLTRATVQYPTTLDGSVVVAGDPAQHVLEIYEDPLCPACGRFEQSAGERLANAVQAGGLQVRYHLVNMLDRLSQPTGYSGLAGNAMMCAAENGAFPDVHTSLYAAQPAEGGATYSAEQLVDLGQRAGAGPGYADCVRGGVHLEAITGNLARAAEDESLVREGRSGFGTPALVLDGRLVETGDDRLELLAPA